MSRWLSFRGYAETDGANYRLHGEGGGIILVPKEHVRVQGATVELKVGAKAQIVEQPQGKKPAVTATAGESIPAGTTAFADCPGKKTYCIGLVEFCCANDEAIGSCIGVWTCN